jgi:excisionase family DNA binding protein
LQGEFFLNFTELEILASKIAPLIASELHVSQWLTMREACDYAKVKDDVLRKWIAKGFIYATKKGGKWVVDRDSINSFYNRDRVF